MGRIGIIINPISGRRGRRPDAGESRAAIARSAAARAGRDADVILTRGAGHAAELARACVDRGVELVVAWGGDGTINDAAGPLIGSATALGIVRSGSGDGLARGLRVPRDPRRALAAAMSGHPAAMDVGYLAGRHFLNVAGIGFDAAVAAAFNRRPRRGLLGYVTTTLSTIWTYPREAYDVTLGDSRIAERCFLVAFANGEQYGGNLRLAARADPQDGWLDAVVIRDGAPALQLWRTRHLLLGVRRSSARIHLARVRSASITGERLVCHVDGEPFETSGRVDVRIEPGAILIAGSALRG